MFGYELCPFAPGRVVFVGAVREPAYTNLRMSLVVRVSTCA
jgi:hypothetical protein